MFLFACLIPMFLVNISWSLKQKEGENWATGQAWTKLVTLKWTLPALRADVCTSPLSALWNKQLSGYGDFMDRIHQNAVENMAT